MVAADTLTFCRSPSGPIQMHKYTLESGNGTRGRRASYARDVKALCAASGEGGLRSSLDSRLIRTFLKTVKSHFLFSKLLEKHDWVFWPKTAFHIYELVSL